jgi:sugar phosphate isomerase/epimerase
MRLGFVSAIFPDLSIEEVLRFAAVEKLGCVELMCWPKGRAERRYAGVTHIDADGFGENDAERIQDLLANYGVGISGLGYYPNPLAADETEAAVYVEHLKKVITAAALLGVRLVNTFVGRDPARSVDDNWPRLLKTWKPLVQFASDQGVRIAIENCPMFFTNSEWPGGKNLATCPNVWRKMFSEIESPNFGLNYDPSHMVWQQMDYIKPLREFANRIFHIHAKDVRIDREKLDDCGILSTPNDYHSPKLPGLGDIDWGRFCSVLDDTGYRGPVCIEVEDRAYEKTLETRKAAVRQSGAYLRNLLVPAG